MMNSKDPTCIPGLVNSLTKDSCNEYGAASSLQQMTKEEQVKLSALKDFEETRFKTCREMADLVEWVELQVNDQEKLVGKEDQPKYKELKEGTMTMIEEAQECFKSSYKGGSLAGEMVGEVGTENSFIHTA